MPRWKVLSIDGFTPLVGVPLAILQMETFSLYKVGTQDPVPEINASSPIRQERLPLLHNISLQLHSDVPVIETVQYVRW